MLCALLTVGLSAGIPGPDLTLRGNFTWTHDGSQKHEVACQTHSDWLKRMASGLGFHVEPAADVFYRLRRSSTGELNPLKIAPGTAYRFR